MEAVAGAYLMSLPGGALLSEGDIGRPVLFTSEALDLPAPGRSVRGDWEGIRIFTSTFALNCKDWIWSGYAEPATWSESDGRESLLHNTLVELTSQPEGSPTHAVEAVCYETGQLDIDGLVVRHASGCLRNGNWDTSTQPAASRVLCDDVDYGLSTDGISVGLVRSRSRSLRASDFGAWLSGPSNEVTLCDQPATGAEPTAGLALNPIGLAEPDYGIRDFAIVGYPRGIRYWQGYFETSRTHVDPAYVPFPYGHETEFLAGDGNSLAPDFTAAECFQDLTPRIRPSPRAKAPSPTAVIGCSTC